MAKTAFVYKAKDGKWVARCTKCSWKTTRGRWDLAASAAAFHRCK